MPLMCPGKCDIYDDCGIWVMVNLYKLTHDIPLGVENPTLAALAYRERFTEFFLEEQDSTIICGCLYNPNWTVI